MTLFEKIQRALSHDEVCILSQQGKHLYAVLPWERYKKLTESIGEPEKTEGTSIEPSIVYETDIDINDIPV
ncbi:MAG: hypothetical protein WC099_02605 [Candidatus Paceibacterota bacterium]